MLPLTVRPSRHLAILIVTASSCGGNHTSTHARCLGQGFGEANAPPGVIAVWRLRSAKSWEGWARVGGRVGKALGGQETRQATLIHPGRAPWASETHPKSLCSRSIWGLRVATKLPRALWAMGAHGHRHRGRAPGAQLARRAWAPRCVLRYELAHNFNNWVFELTVHMRTGDGVPRLARLPPGFSCSQLLPLSISCAQLCCWH
jgi:hypothetical protein